MFVSLNPPGVILSDFKLIAGNRALLKVLVKWFPGVN